MLFFQILERGKRAPLCLLLAVICLVPSARINAQTLLAPSTGGLDTEFNASVATTSNLKINSSATQADGKLVVGGEFSIGGDVPRNSIARLDTSGNLDPTFSNGIGTGGLTQRVNAVAIQPDGKIIVGGQFDQFNGQTARSFVRINPDGSLDTGFLRGTTSGEVNAIVIQPDGKILVAGGFFQIQGVSRNCIARINSDGTVDTTFNPGGGPSNSISAVAYQPDGKVLIGGGFGSYNGNGSIRVLVRLNSDGTLDNSFNNTRDIVGRVYAISVLADGKVLIGGSMLAYGGVIRDKIARLNTDGNLDTSFTAAASGDIYTFHIQPDGKILVGGFFGQMNGVPTGPFTRINADGTNDATFTGTVNYAVNSIHIQPSGHIVAVGGFWQANNTPRNAVARFDANGSLDQAFDPIIGQPGSVNAFAAYPDGSVVMAGVFNIAGGVRRNRLAKVSADGTVDSSFDIGTGANREIYALAVQPDGKILVGGEFDDFNGSTQRALVRLNTNGSLDPTFNIPGGVSNRVRTVKVLSDGRIAVAGEFGFVGGVQRSNIAVLMPNGSLDTSFNANVDSGVHDLVEQPDGKLVIGGVFSLVNTVSRVRIARLLPTGALDPAFNPNAVANGQGVFAMDLDEEGKIVIGGFFSAVNDVSSNNIGRLNTDGTIDESFNVGTGAGFTVFSVECEPNGRIMLAGDFSTFNGQLRNGVARLKNSGELDTRFRPTIVRNGSNRPTLQKILVTQDPNNANRGKLFLGGWFTGINGAGRIGVARMTLSFLSDITPFDFDGDSKTDIGIFRPSVGEWWVNRSSNAQTFALQFGAPTDQIVPADYTGDGKTDIAFFRPATGEWFILRSEDGSFYSVPFGTSGDIPAPADYDGDGKADTAVFRPSTGTWYIQRSADNGTTIAQFGTNGDQPVSADYDGDGLADLAIYRPSNGQWWLNRSESGVIAMTFGNSSDKPVQGDYTGDGKADAAVWRPSTGEWYILRSENMSYYSAPFGTSGDIPAPGDYDGDGKFDATVFRPSNATWYSQRTTAGTLIQQFGANGDTPVPSAFLP